MSPFTAFIAVDACRGTEGTTGPGSRPRQVPDGVRYDTAVQVGR